MAASQAQWPAAVAATDVVGDVLFVTSPRRERVAVRDRLVRGRAPVTVAADPADALAQSATRRFALCLIDLADERAALTAIRLFRAEQPEQALAGVVDPACPLVTAQALHAGLRDLLPWPFEERDLQLLVANALERRAMDVDLAHPESPVDLLFAQAPAMRGVIDAVRIAAAAASSGVCISGEPGSGRQRIARVIHGLAHPASTAPFVAIDCRAGGRHDLEHRLFGVASARNGAGKPTAPEQIGTGGAIWQARGGTLYLASLLEAPSAVQAKLARLLRDGEAIQYDESEARTVDLDLRPIGSCEPGVEAAVGEGRIRRELFERLAQIRIEVPPLRRRRQDIPLLAVHFLTEIAEAEGTPPRALSRAALALLSALPWHGNARELRTLLETVTRTTKHPVLELDDLLEHATLDGISARLEEGMTLRDARSRFEREVISGVLMTHHGRVGDAARALGIQRTNLYRKVRQLNVSRSLLSTRK